MKLREMLIKKLGELEEKAEEFEEKAETKIEGACDYLDKKAEDYQNMDPEKKKELKKGAIGVGVAVIAPWYAAIPAVMYAYKKGKKALGKKEEDIKD